MKYIYILLFFIFSFGNFAKASEISDRRDKQVAKLDQQKQVEAKDKAQSIGNIYSTNKNVYITDTININDMTFGQMISYIKNGDKNCAVTTWDIINVMSYDPIFDEYMKLITYWQPLKVPPWSADYYNWQQVSCLRIVGCRYGTNKIQELINNKAITSENMTAICNDDLPKLYSSLYNNNEKYYYLTRQRIGNEIYMNGDENDSSFDILADVKYIWDIMFWSNQDPSKVFIQDLKKLKKENDKLDKIDQNLQNQSAGSTTAFDPENINNNLTLLAQSTDPTPANTDLFDDPDIKDLLWWSIYGKLLDINTWSKNSFIRSYVNKVNTTNGKQDIWKIQATRDKNNPISNDSWSMTVSNTNSSKRTTSLKDCLKACTSAKTAADVNFCRNSCLCGQIPKDATNTWVDWKIWWVSSLIVIRYCAEPANFTNVYDPKSPQSADKKKQTVEWLTIIADDFLKTINNKDLTPRNISRENFDFDTMFAKFWKEFDFNATINTIDTPTKTYEITPDLKTQPDKVNSNTQNPADAENKKSLADAEFYQIMKIWIDKNVVFWENLQKITNNLKKTAQELRNRINE